MSVAGYQLDDIRTAWRDAALALWREHIRDTQPGYAGDTEAIAELYREIGWGWEIDDGYDESAGHEWCGVGAAVAGLRLGDHLESDRCVPVGLDPDVAELVMPSTDRLFSHQLGGTDYWSEAGVPPAKLIDLDAAESGDIATCYPDKKRWGSHIVVVAGHERNGHLPTIEANATGELPDGSTGEGVVRRKRSVEQVAKVYRFREEHFVSGEEAS